MCPLACDTIAGQKPHHRPPIQAASRLRTRCRDSTQYQAAAVPARPSVSSSTTETPAPRKWVTGASGRLSARIDVFAIMLTPSGEFSRSEKNGLSPWNSTRSPCASMAQEEAVVVVVGREHPAARADPELDQHEHAEGQVAQVRPGLDAAGTAAQASGGCGGRGAARSSTWSTARTGELCQSAV